MGYTVEDTNEAQYKDIAMDVGYRGTSRWRPMSLDTLSPVDDVRRDGQSKSDFFKSGQNCRPGSLYTEGIELSTPAPLYKYTNRGASASPTLTKNWDDLEKNRPRVWIPEKFNRSFTNLTVDDIRGTCSRPQSKLAREARGTSPLDPKYFLPSFPESPFEGPKFVRDSMNVEDIEGAKPRLRPQSRERNHLKSDDIDGAYVGWRPRHRHNFGKHTRDLCLHVEDISPQKQRYVRDPESEVYHKIEGSCPKKLFRPRSAGRPIDLCLNTHDIEGTKAGTALWQSKVKSRKQKGITQDIVNTHQKRAELVAVKILRTKVKNQIGAKAPREVVDTFKKMDRQHSGKLTISEVEHAFKNLNIGLNAAELRVLSTAFDGSTDGFLNYWNMVKHLVPISPRKRDVPGQTYVVPMALKQWSQTEIPPQTKVQIPTDESFADLQEINGGDLKVKTTRVETEMSQRPAQEPPGYKTGDEICSRADVGRQSSSSTGDRIRDGNGGVFHDMSPYTTKENSRGKLDERNTSSTPAPREYPRLFPISNELQRLGTPEHSMRRLPTYQGSSIPNYSMWPKNSEYFSSPDGATGPVPMSGTFSSEASALDPLQVPMKQLSLFYDHHNPPKVSEIEKIKDKEKGWTKRVGGTLFTGKGSALCPTSYAQGNEWGRPRSPEKSLASPSTVWHPMTTGSFSKKQTSKGKITGTPIGSASIGRPSTAGSVSKNQTCRDKITATPIGNASIGRPSTAPNSASRPWKFSAAAARQIAQRMEDIAVVKALT